MHIASPSPGRSVPGSDVADSRSLPHGNGAAEQFDADVEEDTRSDAELLSQFVKTRDAAAFAAIVERYQRLVMGVALRQVGDRHRAEDVFQATFLVLAEKARRIRRPDALPAWLHGTARRIGLAALSESRRHPAMNSTDLTDVGDPVLQQMHSAWERQVLDEELAALPERLRLPLVLHYLEGLTGRQVADRLGLSTDTVEGRLKKGRKELRQRLVKQGVGFGAVLAAFHMSQQIAAAATTTLVHATAASSVAWATHQPLQGCTANAARLAGKDIAAMTAAKTTTIITCTAIACLATGLLGSWALGGNANGRSGPAAIAGIADEASDGSPVEPMVELSLLDASNDEAGDAGAVETGFGTDSGGVGTIGTSDSGAGTSGTSSSGETLRLQVPQPNDGLRSYQKWSAAREQIEEKLDSTVNSSELDGSFLLELTAILREKYEIPVRLDEQALVDSGLDFDQELKWTAAPSVSLRDALALVLENVAGVELDYIIDHGVLKITTRDNADLHFETVVYELRPLHPNLKAEEFAEMIQTLTEGPWFDIDGVGGTVVVLPGAVAVRQTQRIHREIAALLDQVEQFAARSDLTTVERTPKTEPPSNEGGFGYGGGP